jgi:hypothetical protein
VLRIGSSKKKTLFGLISVGYHLELEQARSSIRKKCFGILKSYFFGQTLKSSSKVLFKLNFFSQQPLYIVC